MSADDGRSSNDGQHTNKGLWSQPGVPHKGWVCVGVDDLETPQQLCEMCESTMVRFVHRMEHAHFARRLNVGCVCAQNMEGDSNAPREREKPLRAAAQKRAAFRRSWSRRKWGASKQGNPLITINGYRLLLNKEGRDQYRVLVSEVATFRRKWGTGLYTLDAAKQAALEAFEWAMKAWNNPTD